ncbi:MAG: methylenetetrahydrofolate reductase [Clostridia bacterium]|nr:methylenetetrahydrofolate reductase [Clostridia bacterium]
MNLKEKIIQKKSGILLYGLTPPKKKTEIEKVIRVSQNQLNAVRSIGVDGLILYDIHDEKDRIEEERPFPYLETIDPKIYSETFLRDLEVPRIVYRCVGKYTLEEMITWIDGSKRKDDFTVFVGAASKTQEIQMRLSDAYDLYQKHNNNLTLGGVCIPERHVHKENEHLRVIDKMNKGCSFFVSQAVYNTETALNFLSDYYYYCQSNAIEMVPIIFSISPCGSKKTIDFMKWLGINVSKWLENEILNDENPVEKSVEVLTESFKIIWEFAQKKKIPVGCNVESISISKKEIDASVEMAKSIKKIMMA